MIPAAHVNEHLKRVLPVIGKASPARVAQAVQVPYLTLENFGAGMTKADAEAMHLFDDFGVVRTPFPMFRFACDSGKDSIFGFCERTPSALAVVAFNRSQGGLSKVFWSATFKSGASLFEGTLEYDGRLHDTWTLQDLTNAEQQAKVTTDREKEDVKDLIERVRGNKPEIKRIVKELREDARKLDQAIKVLETQKSVTEAVINLSKGVTESGEMLKPKEAFGMIYGTIMLVCYEYFVPHNFMAKVTPDKPGKSVEWLRAREHYTVIHRHHAANNAAVKEGTKVYDDKHLTRLAHSRRAHTKLLTHPKWTHKRGQRIFVKASWVGPQEWKDTAGQIYTIVPKNNLAHENHPR